MVHEGYFNKIYNICVALPHIVFEKIITCKSKKKIITCKRKRNQNKQFSHKYEICLWEMI